MKRILIVETDAILRGIYRRKFEMSGFEVEAADDGPKALKLLTSFRPDLVLMDIMLPGMEGTQVIREIRCQLEFKSVPIIVLSSFYRPDLAKQAWEAGASKCISKMDCTPSQALEIVEQVLSGETPDLSLPAVTSQRARGMHAAEAMTEPEQVAKPAPFSYIQDARAAEMMAEPHQERALLEAEPSFSSSQSLPLSSRSPSSGTVLPFAATPPASSGTPPRTGQTEFRRKSSPKEGTVLPFAATPPASSGMPPRTGQTEFRQRQPSGPAAAPLPSAGTPPRTGHTEFRRSVAAAKAAAARLPGTPSGPGARSGRAEPALTVEAPAEEAKPAEGAADSTGDFRLEVRQEFLKRVPQLQADLRDRVSALIKSKSPEDQLYLLNELNVSVSSLAGLAGVTGYTRIAHLAGALEALSKDLQKKPKQMTSSVLRTMAHASDCLNLLVKGARNFPQAIPQSILILAVDDEPISRRTISVALGKASLRCLCLEDSRMALKILEDNAFDLIFLDAEMPGLNGFELCSELRKLPTNHLTPVIFVTSLTHFEIRARSSLSGGNDLIAKPFLMMELAVKALTYLLKPRAHNDPKATAAATALRE